MQILDSEQIRALASMPRLIDCLEDAFRTHCVVPPRQVIPVPGGTGGRLFVSMPAFDSQGSTVVKLATVFPDNPAEGLPTIHAAVVVFSSRGEPARAAGRHDAHAAQDGRRVGLGLEISFARKQFASRADRHRRAGSIHGCRALCRPADNEDQYLWATRRARYGYCSCDPHPGAKRSRRRRCIIG